LVDQRAALFEGKALTVERNRQPITLRSCQTVVEFGDHRIGEMKYPGRVILDLGADPGARPLMK